MRIWKIDFTLDQLNGDLFPPSMSDHLGIEYTAVGEDFIKATMPVNEKTRQPFGFLHGGASMVLAETLGSAAANLCVDQETSFCVGLDINGNHIRAVREGLVEGTAKPLHLGRSTQVWEINIRDEEANLVAVCRLTVAVKDRPS